MRRVRGQTSVLRQKGLMEKPRTKSMEDTERGKRDRDAGQRCRTEAWYGGGGGEDMRKFGRRGNTEVRGEMEGEVR